MPMGSQRIKVLLRVMRLVVVIRASPMRFVANSLCRIWTSGSGVWRWGRSRVLGHGSVRAVARAAQVSETTVRKGVAELEAGEAPLGRIGRPGGGRKRAVDLDPGLRPALLALVEPLPCAALSGI